MIHKYLDFAIKYNYTFVMCKYTLQQILGSEQDSAMGKKFLASSTMRDLCAVFGREQEIIDRQVSSEPLSSGLFQDGNASSRVIAEVKHFELNQFSDG